MAVVSRNLCKSFGAELGGICSERALYTVSGVVARYQG